MMNDQEIDFELALAIGYAPDRVRNRFYRSCDLRHSVQVFNDFGCRDGSINYDCWQRFEHKDPAVIWPIAERFDAFPERRFNYACEHVSWHCWANSKGYGIHNNPATATALAVIEYFEKGRP